MRTLHRRDLLALIGVGTALAGNPASSSPDDASRRFLQEAVRMRDLAVAGGDQPYGAVLVQDGRIIGYGPSRVIAERDEDAHAERVAIREARRQFGVVAVEGAVLYSTSRPCRTCERAAAAAGIARMIHGSALSDVGRPRP